MNSNTRLGAVLATAVFAICALCAVPAMTDDSDVSAVGDSSVDVFDYLELMISPTDYSSDASETFYVWEGCYVGISMANMNTLSYTSGFGLVEFAVEGGHYVYEGIDGYLSKTGTLIVNISNTDGIDLKFTIYSCEVIDGIKSISNRTMGTESSRIDVGVWATNYTTAFRPTFTAEVTSGTDVVSITYSNAASGMMTHVYVTPLSVGTATITVTAVDNSKLSASFTVSVNETLTGTLTFNANGGSNAPAQLTYDSYYGSYYYDIPTTIPVRSGYTFLGWAESASATEPEYTVEQTDTTDNWYQTTTRYATLYAVWEESLQTYSAVLSYNANGGSNAPASQTASITAASATGSKTFVVSSTVPVRDGYDFLGWSTSSTATAASYTSGDSLSVSYGSTVTLYAVWKQASVTVSGSPAAYGVVGTSWSFTPTLSVSDCTLSVSGASWLVASDGTIVGTPATAGTYEVTVTASKSGYVSGTMTFTVTVLTALSFESSPEGGAIIYAV
ncbi:MAG: InlB B-repeat-containing protein [Thermoplasmata archaeon]|nr:InlB B-repeat-containing protein [Thermoplasmata archaeon]